MSECGSAVFAPAFNMQPEYYCKLPAMHRGDHSPDEPPKPPDIKFRIEHVK